MGLHMGQYLGQRLEQRQQLALRQEMRLEMRLEQVLIQALDQYGLFDVEGVEDTGRIRIFDLPIADKKTIPVVAKILPRTADPYREATTMRECAARGLVVPELLGVGESNGMFIQLTTFNPDVINCATAMTRAVGTLQAYAEHRQIVEAGVPVEGMLADLEQSVALAIGRELARLHRAGIDKADLTPRNLLLSIDRDRNVSLIHTGFRQTTFCDQPLSRKRRREQLQQVKHAFEGMHADLASAYAPAVMRGYFAAYYDAALGADGDPATVGRAVRGAAIAAVQDEIDRASSAMVAEARQVVMDLPLEKMTMVDMGAALYAIVERYVRLDGVGYEEQRPRKQLLWLYDQWKRFGVPGKLEEMEREAPYEIATDATTASRQIKPLTDSLGVPLPRDLLSTMNEALVLRYAREYPELPGIGLFDRMQQSSIRGLMDGLGIGKVRTLNKYMKALRDSGAIHALRPRDAGRVVAAVAESFTAGTIIDTRECARELGLDETAVRPLVDLLRARHLGAAVAEAARTHTMIDVAALACVLDLPIALVRETAMKAGALNPSADTVPPAAEPPVTISPGPVPNPLPHVPSPHSQVPITAPDPDIVAENLDVRLLAEIEREANCPTDTLAERCGITPAQAEERLRVLRRGIEGRWSEVDRLIRSQPGIDDAGIRERTGLSVAQVHLLVRPLLLNQALHP